MQFDLLDKDEKRLKLNDAEARHLKDLLKFIDTTKPDLEGYRAWVKSTISEDGIATLNGYLWKNKLIEMMACDGVPDQESKLKKLLLSSAGRVILGQIERQETWEMREGLHADNLGFLLTGGAKESIIQHTIDHDREYLDKQISLEGLPANRSLNSELTTEQKSIGQKKNVGSKKVPNYKDHFNPM